MKKKIFVAEYVAGDKSVSFVLNILAYDAAEAEKMGWDSFDHTDGKFIGRDSKASLIITDILTYNKNIPIHIK